MKRPAPKDPLFFRHFYREAVGRLARELLDGRTFGRYEYVKGKRRHRPLTLKMVGEFLSSFVNFAEDDGLCHSSCKLMYFCERKKGHKGRHTAADGGLGWSEDEADGPSYDAERDALLFRLIEWDTRATTGSCANCHCRTKVRFLGRRRLCRGCYFQDLNLDLLRGRVPSAA